LSAEAPQLFEDFFVVRNRAGLEALAGSLEQGLHFLSDLAPKVFVLSIFSAVRCIQPAVLGRLFLWECSPRRRIVYQNLDELTKTKRLFEFQQPTSRIGVRSSSY
jgi:hypothetical protein